jgi:arabinogalactan endo-1,4-beta-galactosidase
MKYITLIFVTFFLWSCKKNNDNPPPVSPTDDFIRGADLSFLPEIEQASAIFYTTDNIPGDCIFILKQSGCNTIRLRLWHSPLSQHSSIAEVAEFAKKIKLQNLKILLNIQYSDSWADPGQQSKPDAWAGLSTNILSDSIYNYTKTVVSLIQPDYVQIGNEINEGFVWENGRFNNTSAFILLLSSGIKAVRDNNINTKIILHYAGISGAVNFYSTLKSYATDYDMIGLSYYPIWHGKSLDLLETTMKDLNTLTSKPVIIAETAYPFTLGYNDYTNNVVGLPSQIIPEYPATPAGQLSYMQALITKIKATPKGAGFIYWGGEWIAFKGNTSTTGSPWENQALFDFNNKSLPVMEVFKK